MKLTTSSGDTHEPLDLSTSTSRSTDSTITVDSLHSEPAGLPSPSASEPDCKPVQTAIKALDDAVPCRRSARQRRRTAKAAGDDGSTSAVDVLSPRRHRNAGRPAYVCQLCDKQFTKHSSLVRHTYQHSGETLRIFTFLSSLSCTLDKLARPSLPLVRLTSK